MTAHDLHDGDHLVVVHASVLVDLHAGGRDILRGAAEAGAVVGAEEIVVDRLGNTHHTAFVAHGFHVAADLVAGVHGIVAAVVEEIPHVILLKDLEDLFIVRVVRIRVRDLITAGAELG